VAADMVAVVHHTVVAEVVEEVMAAAAAVAATVRHEEVAIVVDTVGEDPATARTRAIQQELSVRSRDLGLLGGLFGSNGKKGQKLKLDDKAVSLLDLDVLT
jgi:hypothetical protein